MSNLLAKEYQAFESIKRIAESGDEFWLARELAPALEYVQWRNFSKVLDRAMLACKNSGYSVVDHFAEVSKTIAIGKEVRKAIERVGGTMPEDLPTPEKSVSQIEKEQLRQLKQSKKKLMLDE